MNPVEPTLFGWLLLAVTAAYGSYSVAAGPGHRTGGFQALTPPGYEYHPEYPAEPSVYIQRQNSGVPGFHSQSPEGDFYTPRLSRPTPSVSGQGFKFRDLPTVPRVEQPLPRFRPDSLSGRSPYSWGTEDGRWPEGSIGPPPVFRPLKKKLDSGGTVRRQLRYSGGEYSNGMYDSGWTGYASGRGGYRPLPGR